jgi:ABC-2 type transport system ATP-binding protein
VQSSNEWVGRFRDGRMDHPPALSARGITKRFGRKVVLDGVDLDVWPGEAVALVGENGAGKTTLLRICAGLLAADAGEMRVSGAVGYCPQDAGLLDLLTADEHLLLFGRATRQSREGALGGTETLETFGFPLGEQAVRCPAQHLSRVRCSVVPAISARPSSRAPYR